MNRMHLNLSNIDPCFKHGRKVLRRVSILSLLVFFGFVGGCAPIDPSNPYDPVIGPELRARGSLQGNLSATEFLEIFDYSQMVVKLELQLDHEIFDPVTHETASNSKGEFAFKNIVAGRYLLSAEGSFQNSLFTVEPVLVLIYQDETTQDRYFLRRSINLSLD